MTSTRFTRLLVIRRATSNKWGEAMWICKCDCGNTVTVDGHSLRRLETKSFGCLQKDTLVAMNFVHGFRRRGEYVQEYTAWKSMRSRCLNKKTKYYSLYGGRGIKVCDRWLHSFQNFFDDMGEKPSSKHSLDRWPNNNGHYEPGNCRWATSIEQSLNRRNNRFVTAFGETKTVSQWSRELGINDQTIHSRMKRGIVGDAIISIPDRRIQRASSL